MVLVHVRPACPCSLARTLTTCSYLRFTTYHLLEYYLHVRALWLEHVAGPEASVGLW